MVAPTTNPKLPSGSAPRLSCEISSMTVCATVRPSAPRARWTLAPSGLEVSASTKTPPPCLLATSNIGASELTPRNGLAVTASTYIGLDGSRYASA
jgi:hypothetical protein